MPEQDNFDKNSNSNGIFSALSLAWELGYTIAIPIVVFALLGRFLDKWLHTSPWLLLIGIFVSIIISSFAIYFKTVRIINESNNQTANGKRQ